MLKVSNGSLFPNHNLKNLNITQTRLKQNGLKNWLNKICYKRVRTK